MHVSLSTVEAAKVASGEEETHGEEEAHRPAPSSRDGEEVARREARTSDGGPLFPSSTVLVFLSAINK